MAVSGTGVAGDKITLTVDSHTYTQTVAADGTWSFSFTLAVGVHTFAVYQTDPVSNLSSTTTSATTTVFAPPSAPTISGPSISDQTVPLSGSCVSGDTVTIYDHGIAIATTSCSSGSWSITLTLAVGSHTLSATQTDPASHFTSVVSGNVNVTVYAPPAAPGMTVPSSSTSSVPVTGTGVAGDKITLTLDAHTTYTVTVAANGTWSFSLSLSLGTHTLSATQTDPVSGLVSSATTATVNVHH